jgi:GntR family histidine utilization transcriptional repressor
LSLAGEPKDRSLHKRIRADIAERISSGAWPPGHRIPFEHQLMAEYGCSRMTVNRALSPLAESGLLVRRRRAGTFVSRPKIHSVLLDIPDIQAEIVGRGEPYKFELLSRKIRAANRRNAQELELAGSGHVIALRCLHRASGRPFALEERLINLFAVPEAEAVDFAATPPGTWLLAHVPWTEAEHRISAVNLPKSTAAVLGVEPSTACLSLERKTFRGEDHITYVRLLFPGDAYDLVARFTPS